MLRIRWRDYFENILVAIFLALFVRTFILTGYKVPSSSMQPTLKPGDFIFSYRLPYGIKIPLTQIKFGSSQPKIGEVVVFTFPEQPRVNYVKRIVALSGDRVEQRNGEVFVNDQKLRQEVSPAEGAGMAGSFSFPALIVPPGEVFLLADSHDASNDPRYWGTVPIDRIEGQVFLIWLSMDWNQKLTGSLLPTLRTDRIFSSVH